MVISLTLETDGRLPTGQALKDAIAEVDGATDNGPAYYMINCPILDDYIKAAVKKPGNFCSVGVVIKTAA
jgi:S-methylmethionine-dependent homocysteine/selenocysteine methylase